MTADDLATGLLIITSGNSDRGRVQLFHSEHLNSRDYCTYHIQMHIPLCAVWCQTSHCDKERGASEIWSESTMQYCPDEE